MKGAVTIHIVYGASLSLSVTYRSLNPDGSAGSAINVTGYTAELRISRYDGTTHGTTVLLRTSAAGQVSVGTTNGLFQASLSNALTAALSTTFGSPIPREFGRWSLWIMPPAGVVGVDDFPVAHGWVELHQVGEAVDPVAIDAFQAEFTATVSAVGAKGDTGPTGPTGAQGPAGQGGLTTYGPITSTTATTQTIGTVSLASFRGTSFSLDFRIKADRSGETRVWSGTQTGSVAANGTVTLDLPVYANFGEVDWGAPELDSVAVDAVRLRFAADDTTSTTVVAYGQLNILP